MEADTAQLNELERRRIGMNLYREPALWLLPTANAWKEHPKLTMLLAFFEPHDHDADRPDLRQQARLALADGTLRFRQQVIGMAWDRRELKSLRPRHLDILRAMDRPKLDAALHDASLPTWLHWTMLEEGEPAWRRHIVWTMSRDPEVAQQLLEHDQLYVRWWAARAGNLDESDYRRLAKSDEPRMRAAVAGASSCPSDVLRDLCYDTNDEVVLAATDRFWNHRFPDPEETREALYSRGGSHVRSAIARHLPRGHRWMARMARHPDPLVRLGAAENRSLPRHLVDELLHDPDHRVKERARKTLPYWKAQAKLER